MEASHLNHEAQELLFKEDLTEEDIDMLSNAFAGTNEDIANLLADAIRHSDPAIRAGIGHSYSQGEAKDEAGIIEKMETPLAIIHGQEDQLINADYFNQVSMPTLWQEKVHYIDKASHCPQLENPPAFNDLLKDFTEYAAKSKG